MNHRVVLIINGVKELLAAACVLISIIFLVLGVAALSDPLVDPQRGYLLLLVGSCSLVLLPNRTRLVASPSVLVVTMAIALCACVVTQRQIFSMLLDPISISWPVFCQKWFTSIVCFIIFFVAWQNMRRKCEVSFDAKDGYIAIAAFVVAFLWRSWGVVTRSPVPIDDEMQVFSNVLTVGGYVNINPLGTLNSFPSFYYWVVSFLHEPVRAFIDLFSFQKLLAAFAGAVSIPLWYLIVRLYDSRIVAVIFASFLCFVGWHWINSRFLYCYPYDFAFVAAAMLCILLSLRRHNVFLAMLSGMFCALTLIFQKIGLLVCPLIAYVLFEAFLRGDKATRKSVALLACIWVAAIAFFYSPVFLYGGSPHNPEGVLPRQSGVMASRRAELSSAGISEFEALKRMSIDVFLQLQRLEFDSIRHLVRLKGPILDPLLSGLFFLGLVSTVITFFRSERSRLCVLGFILFTAPMVLSFPIDSGLGHGLSRRLLGTAPFVIWMAALGASLLLQRTLSTRYHTLGALLLCCGSAHINLHYVFADYLGPNNPPEIAPHKDLAVQRASSIKLLRALAQSGIPITYYWDSRGLAGGFNTKDLQAVTRDLPHITHVTSVEELRAAIQSYGSKPQFVVVPAPTVFMDKLYQDIPAQLTDIVPAHVWIPGPVDMHMIPTSWYAFVRGAQ